MEKIARRNFCAAALVAFPLLRLHAQESEVPYETSDSVLEALADEIILVTADGAERGFKAEHFRRYAGIVRTFDAHLEDKGTNRDLNERLDDEDFYKVNPALTAKITVEYWRKKGIYFNENEFAARLAMDPTSYRETKKAIRKQGGIRAVHKAIAVALDRKAKDYETVALRGGPAIRNGRIAVGEPGTFRQPEFMAAQYDMAWLYGAQMDCLCKAMVTEGVILTIACLTCPGCQAVCVPAGIMLAMEKLFESFGWCVPSRC
jgi:hypothetical protein